MELIVFGPEHRQFKVNGFWVSPIIDSYRFLSKESSCVCIRKRSWLRLDSYKSISNFSYTGHIYLRALGLCYLNKLIKLMFQREVCSLEELFWKLVIDRYSIDFVVGIQPPLALCKVASEKEIVVMDLQHGHINNSSNYYNSLKSKKTQERPAGVYLWDELSEKKFTELVGGDFELKVVGNPWHRMLNLGLDFTNEENVPLIKHARKLADAKYGKGKQAILLSLGWGMTKQWDGKTLGLPIWCKELPILCKNYGFNFIVRLHPTTIKRFGYKKPCMAVKRFFETEELVIDDGVGMPLPFLLEKSILHVTSKSSVALEASWFNIKSLFLLYEDDLIPDIYANNQLFAEIKDYKSLVNKIEEILCLK